MTMTKQDLSKNHIPKNVDAYEKYAILNFLIPVAFDFDSIVCTLQILNPFSFQI